MLESPFSFPICSFLRFLWCRVTHTGVFHSCKKMLPHPNPHLFPAVRFQLGHSSCSFFHLSLVFFPLKFNLFLSLLLRLSVCLPYTHHHLHWSPFQVCWIDTSKLKIQEEAREDVGKLSGKSDLGLIWKTLSIPDGPIYPGSRQGKRQ